MNRYNNVRLFYIFIRIFIVLVVILLIMPSIIEQAMLFFNQSIAPKDNSVNVFKYPVEKYVKVSRFIEILKKIINFM